MPGSKILLDTNAVIAFFRPVTAITEILTHYDALLLPVVVLGELKFGIEKSTQKEKNKDRLNQFGSRCEIVPVLEKTTDFYAAIQNELRAKGKPIPDNDLWIAAIALEHNVPILTQDRHFEVVDQIQKVTW